MIHGSCLCGAVTFDATPTAHAVTCYCTQCRKQSGHIYAATPTPLENLHITKDNGLSWFRASTFAKRGFCRHCGSFLFWQHDDEKRVFVSCGAFDGPTGLLPGDPLCSEDAGDYYSISGPPPQLSSAPETLQASCLCGKNHFTLPGPMGAVTACHCTQCRKTSGHFSASFDRPESDLHWHARHITEHATQAGSQRGFCTTCASSLYFRAADGSFSVEAGCIDAPTGGHLTTHIFTADKGDYYTLTDGLPAHPGAEPS